MTLLTLSLFFLACCASTLVIPGIIRYLSTLETNYYLRCQLRHQRKIIQIQREEIERLRATIKAYWYCPLPGAVAHHLDQKENAGTPD